MKNLHRKAVLYLMLPLVALASAGFIYSSDTYFQIKKNFTIFNEVYEEVSKRYVVDIDPDKVIQRGINAMLETLDPYTVLIDESQSRDMDIMTTGQYAGVGLEVGARGGKLVVIAPIEGYSAHRRGVRAGDVILRVNDLDVSNFSPEDLQTQLRGESGTQVTIVVKRYGIDQELEFELTRESIEVKNIVWAGLLEHTDKRIGYVLLRRFGQNAASEVAEAIMEMKEEAELDAFVLDMRNNPGGLLDEAVKLTDLFVDAGESVVATKGRLPETNFSYETQNGVLFSGKPLFVLQNNGSASASEIVAGALQDLDKAVIIGERSFGKGLVQIVRPLSYNMAVKITTSKYYTPSGRSLQSMEYIGEEETADISVPDSIRQVFKTRSGREVYEGLGIEPDIAIDEHKLSLLEIALLRNSHYFFFANQYASENDEFSEDNLNEELYKSFNKYLDAEEFDFETRSQRYYENMKATLSDQIRGDVASQLEELNTIIKRDKEMMMKENKEFIKRELFLEIVSRYEGNTGRIKRSLTDDPMILKVKELTDETETYFSILQ